MDLFAGKPSRLTIEQVSAKIRGCVKCFHRNEVFSPVPGFGAVKDCLLFVIGQTPARGEDVLGRILTKPGGEKIRSSFYENGFTDEQIYWGNVANCPLPSMMEELSEEQSNNCAMWLEDTIEALTPKVIVGLGNVCKRRFFTPKHMKLEKEDISDFASVQFKEWDYRGYTLVFMLNPAGILRQKGYEKTVYEEGLKKDFVFLKSVLRKKRLI